MSESQWGRRIVYASRHSSGVTVKLECDHAVLRHPSWPIPTDLTTDCEVCAADWWRATHASASA